MVSTEEALQRQNQAAQARVGQTLLGKWKLERLIGAGASAAVYAARHRNGHAVAVKVLHQSLSVSPVHRERFLREGYAANAVRHPNVLRVQDDAVAEDGSVFLVMDLLEGESVASFAARHPFGVLSPDDVLALVEQVLGALAEAHAHGVVHRDIKPDNLFRTTDGRIMLVDFGVARIEERSALTMIGHTLGSPSYMAPEQALGKSLEVGPRSDLFSVGATMYRLLIGRPVHEGTTVNEVLVQAASAQAPRCLDVAPQMDPRIAKIVDRALAFSSEDRFVDAAEFKHAVSVTRRDRADGPRTAEDLPRVAPKHDDDEPTNDRRTGLVAAERTQLSASDNPFHTEAPLVPALPPMVGSFAADRPIATRSAPGPSLVVVVGGSLLLLVTGVLLADKLSTFLGRGPKTTFVAPPPAPPSASVQHFSVPETPPSASASPSASLPVGAPGKGRPRGTPKTPTRDGPVRLEPTQPPVSPFD